MLEAGQQLFRRPPRHGLGKVLGPVAFAGQTGERRRQRPVQFNRLQVRRVTGKRGRGDEVMEPADQREQHRPRHPARELRRAALGPGQQEAPLFARRHEMLLAPFARGEDMPGQFQFVQDVLHGTPEVGGFPRDLRGVAGLVGEQPREKCLIR